MYTRVSRRQSSGKIYEYLQMWETYCNGKGQLRTRVLDNFGRIDRLDRAKFRSLYS